MPAMSAANFFAFERERLSAWNLTLLIVLGSLAYACSLVIYRLTFSPLAQYPGPRLAAATGWYEVYYELFYKGGGQFPFHVEELHARYGECWASSALELDSSRQLTSHAKGLLCESIHGSCTLTILLTMILSTRPACIMINYNP